MLELIGRAHAQTLPTLEFINNNTASNPSIVIVNILQWFLIFVAAIAVIYLVYGGVMYITAGGNPDQATKARTAIINAVIGIVIVLAAYVIVTWVGQITSHV